MTVQLHFDFDTPVHGWGRGDPEWPRDPLERGYRQHRAEQEAGLRELERRFGIVLNRRVRVTLRGIPGEFEGKLILDQLLHPVQRGDELRLRVGRVSFDRIDLESCVVLGE